MKDGHSTLPWRLGLLAALAVTAVALYPQLNLRLKRGPEWNGSYAFFSQDEIAYSAYVRALMDGRPRRNDPYTGRDDAPGSPQHESLFSIQFVPAYAVALPARALGVSAPTAFIVLAGLVAFGAALAVFWLVGLLTGDGRFAAACAVAVPCLGTYAVVYAPVRALLGLDTTYTFEYFPFLRRYVPALPFPLLFLFCALVWRALTSRASGEMWRRVLATGLVFAVLVFSYFYLWTAAAAWLFCLALLWLAARPEGHERARKVFAWLALACGAVLVPYFVLVSRRAPTMDSVQLLAFSHRPDLGRSSIRLGLLVCALVAYFAWRGRLRLREPAVLFAASLALAPLVVFNQQVLTGRSLQPLHYELYVAKYLSLLALFLAAFMIWRGRGAQPRKVPGRALLCAALLALGWGAFETLVEMRRHEWASLDRDEALGAARRLSEIGRAAGPSPDTRSVVLYFNLDHADVSVVAAPQPVLWAPHTPAFSGVSTEENRERLYQYLYYTGEDFAGVDPSKFDSVDYRRRYLVRSMMDWGYNDPAWTVNWKEITPEEVRGALDAYARYTAGFDREHAARPLLSYVVAPADGSADFRNLDRWYERDAGERTGPFVIYRVRLRED